jgi:hypothetical protein
VTTQLDMRFKPATTTEDWLQYAYRMGHDCGLNGPNKTNCHFRIFSTREFTNEWERGKTAGEAEKIKRLFTPKKRDITARRHKGNPESEAANPTPLAKTLQASLIYNWFLKHPGSTCEQCEDGTGIAHQTCSARVSDLKCSGHLVKVGRGTTRSGSSAATYEAVKRASS